MGENRVAYRKERYRLRFFGLSTEMEGSIRTALPGAEFKPPRSSLPSVTNILLFDLHEGIDLSSLYATLDTQQLEPVRVEVIASLVTTSDNAVICLPL